jgi:FMN phosphatase YigB (HAD superfamily)
VDADQAIHVGDSPDNDVKGARAAGIRAVLLQRDGEPPPGVEHIRSLRELAPLL